MGCLPTYKGKRYKSLNEIKSIISTVSDTQSKNAIPIISPNQIETNSIQDNAIIPNTFIPQQQLKEIEKSQEATEKLVKLDDEYIDKASDYKKQINDYKTQLNDIVELAKKSKTQKELESYKVQYEETNKKLNNINNEFNTYAQTTENLRGKYTKESGLFDAKSFLEEGLTIGSVDKNGDPIEGVVAYVPTRAEWATRAINNPLRIDNPDGSYSTVKTAVFTVTDDEGKDHYIVAPTIRLIDGELRELDGKQSYDLAMKKGDYIDLGFKSIEEANNYSKALSDAIGNYQNQNEYKEKKYQFEDIMQKKHLSSLFTELNTGISEIDKKINEEKGLFNEIDYGTKLSDEEYQQKLKDEEERKKEAIEGGFEYHPSEEVPATNEEKKEAKRMRNEKIEQLKSAKRIMERTKNMLEGYVEDWDANWIDGATERGVFDLFTQSISEISEFIDINKAADKITNGEELSDTDKKLLTAYATLQEVTSVMEEKGGISYGSAKGIVDMLPFIVELLATAGVGGASKVGIEKGIVKIAERKIKKNVADKFVKKEFGDLFEHKAYKKLAESGTTLISKIPQVMVAPSTYANTGRRMAGSVKQEMGGIKVGNRQSAGEAFIRSVGENTVEYFTEEMFKTLDWEKYMSPLGNGLKKLSKSKYLTGAANKSIKNIVGQSKNIKGAKGIAEKLAKGSPIGGGLVEFNEEVVSGLVQPYITGEGSPEDFFETENLIKTLLITQVAGAGFGAVSLTTKTGSYAYNLVKQNQINKTYNSLNDGQKQIVDLAMMAESPEEQSLYLMGLATDKELDGKAKMNILNMVRNHDKKLAETIGKYGDAYYVGSKVFNNEKDFLKEVEKYVDKDELPFMGWTTDVTAEKVNNIIEGNKTSDDYTKKETKKDVEVKTDEVIKEAKSEEVKPKESPSSTQDIEISGDEIADLEKEIAKSERKQREIDKNKALEESRKSKPSQKQTKDELKPSYSTKIADMEGETVLDKDGNEGDIVKATNGAYEFHSKDGKRIIELGSVEDAKTATMYDYDLQIKPSNDFSKARQLNKGKAQDQKQISEEEVEKIQSESDKAIKKAEEDIMSEIKEVKEDIVQVGDNFYMVKQNGDKFIVLKESKNNKLVGVKNAEERDSAINEFNKEKDKIESKQLDDAVKRIEGFKKQEEDRILNLLDKAIKGTSSNGRTFDATLGLPIAMINTSLKVIRAAYKAGKSLTEAINKGIEYIKEKGYDVNEIEYKKSVLGHLKKGTEYSKTNKVNREDKSKEAPSSTRGKGSSITKKAIKETNVTRKKSGKKVAKKEFSGGESENRILDNINKLYKKNKIKGYDLTKRRVDKNGKVSHVYDEKKHVDAINDLTDKLEVMTQDPNSDPIEIANTQADLQALKLFKRGRVSKEEKAKIMDEIESLKTDARKKTKEAHQARKEKVDKHKENIKEALKEIKKNANLLNKVARRLGAKGNFAVQTNNMKSWLQNFDDLANKKEKWEDKVFNIYRDMIVPAQIKAGKMKAEFREKGEKLLIDSFGSRAKATAWMSKSNFVEKSGIMALKDGKREEMHITKDFAMQLYMHYKNPKGRQVMEEIMGIDTEAYKQLKTFLGKDAMKVVDGLIGTLKEIKAYEDVVASDPLVYGMPIGEVEGVYTAPMKRKGHAEDFVRDTFNHTYSSTPSHHKMRVNSDLPFDDSIGAFVNFEKYLRDAINFTAYRKLNSELNMIFKDPSIKAGIEDTMGKDFYNYIDYLIATQTGLIHYEKSGMDKAMRMFQKGAILWAAGVGMKQMVSTVHYFVDMNPVHFIKGFPKFTAKSMVDGTVENAVKKIIKAHSFVKNRNINVSMGIDYDVNDPIKIIGDSDSKFNDITLKLRKGLKVEGKELDYWNQKIGGYILKFGDKFPIVYGGGTYIMDKYKRNAKEYNKTHDDKVSTTLTKEDVTYDNPAFAETMVDWYMLSEPLQQSGENANKSALRTKSSFHRALGGFMSATHQISLFIGSNTRQLNRNITKGDMSGALNNAYNLAVVGLSQALIQFIDDDFKKKDDSNLSYLLSFLSGVPVVGVVGAKIITQGANRYYYKKWSNEKSPIPVVDMMYRVGENVLRATSIMNDKTVSDEEKRDAYIRLMVSVAQMRGYNAFQFKKAYDGIKELLTEGELTKAVDFMTGINMDAEGVSLIDQLTLETSTLPMRGETKIEYLSRMKRVEKTFKSEDRTDEKEFIDKYRERYNKYKNKVHADILIQINKKQSNAAKSMAYYNVLKHEDNSPQFKKEARDLLSKKVIDAYSFIKKAEADGYSQKDIVKVLAYYNKQKKKDAKPEYYRMKFKKDLEGLSK